MIITRTPYRISFVGGGSDLAASFNVSPHAAFDDCLDCFSVCLVATRDFAHAHTLFVLLAHIAYVLLGETRSAIQLATHHLIGVLARVVTITARSLLRKHPRPMLITMGQSFRVTMYYVVSLCGHIPHVVRVCAEKQVFGVAAGRVVAAVQYPEIIGDGSVGKFVGNAVRQTRGSFVGHLAITMAAKAQLPRPTVVIARYADVRPETLRECFGKSILGHVGTSFLSVGHAHGCLQQRVGFLMPNYSTQR